MFNRSLLIHPARRVVFVAAVALLALLAAACSPGQQIEEDAWTAEAPTPTSTPTPTSIVPPTNTPVPPTNTPVPPTETPVPPTLTPVPPTPTAVPLFVSLPAAEGDVGTCDTRQPATDGEVDIVKVEAAIIDYTYNFSATVAGEVVTNTATIEDGLHMVVTVGDPLVNDYSFAVLLIVLTEGTASNGYLWEIHDVVYRIGQIDQATGDVIAGLADGIVIEARPPNATAFYVPLPSGAQQFAVRTFHSANETAEKTCDRAGPFNLADLPGP